VITLKAVDNIGIANIPSDNQPGICIDFKMENGTFIEDTSYTHVCGQVMMSTLEAKTLHNLLNIQFGSER